MAWAETIAFGGLSDTTLYVLFLGLFMLALMYY